MTALQKEIVRWRKLAQEQGWTIRVSSRGGHEMWFPRDTTMSPVAMAMTPGRGNSRAWTNTEARLRASGLRIPGSRPPRKKK